MSELVRTQKRISRIVFITSLLAWLLIVIFNSAHGDHHHHGLNVNEFSSFSMLLSDGFILNWIIMLIAMMLPTLPAPLCHIWERNFAHKRLNALFLFLIAYMFVWIVIGIFLRILLMVLLSFKVNSLWLLFTIAAITFIWQCSPIKQKCLNRNHNHRELSAFGLKANFDVLRFGVEHGLWCAGSCWLLMLLPMFVSQGHLIIMLIITLIMVNESLNEPTFPKWRLRSPIHINLFKKPFNLFLHIIP